MIALAADVAPARVSTTPTLGGSNNGSAERGSPCFGATFRAEAPSGRNVLPPGKGHPEPPSPWSEISPGTSFRPERASARKDVPPAVSAGSAASASAASASRLNRYSRGRCCPGRSAATRIRTSMASRARMASRTARSEIAQSRATRALLGNTRQPSSSAKSAKRAATSFTVPLGSFARQTMPMTRKLIGRSPPAETRGHGLSASGCRCLPGSFRPSRSVSLVSATNSG